MAFSFKQGAGSQIRSSILRSFCFAYACLETAEIAHLDYSAGRLPEFRLLLGLRTHLEDKGWERHEKGNPTVGQGRKATGPRWRGGQVTERRAEPKCSIPQKSEKQMG